MSTHARILVNQSDQTMISTQCFQAGQRYKCSKQIMTGGYLKEGHISETYICYKTFSHKFKNVIRFPVKYNFHKIWPKL